MAEKEIEKVNGEMFEAIRTGNVAKVSAALRAGARAEAADAQGSSSLIAAGSAGYAEIVEALIAAGANVEAKDRNGCTALMIAVHLGHVECVRVLMNAGADAQAKDVNGYTALMHAIGKESLGCVEALLAGGGGCRGFGCGVGVPAKKISKLRNMGDAGCRAGSQCVGKGRAASQAGVAHGSPLDEEVYFKVEARMLW